MSRTPRENLRARLIQASVASCTCGRKSPELSAHDSMCHYKLLMESYEMLGETSASPGAE